MYDEAQSISKRDIVDITKVGVPLSCEPTLKASSLLVFPFAWNLQAENQLNCFRKGAYFWQIDFTSADFVKPFRTVVSQKIQY